jgi:hypothetical protein
VVNPSSQLGASIDQSDHSCAAVADPRTQNLPCSTTTPPIQIPSHLSLSAFTCSMACFWRTAPAPCEVAIIHFISMVVVGAWAGARGDDRTRNGRI